MSAVYNNYLAWSLSFSLKYFVLYSDTYSNVTIDPTIIMVVNQPFVHTNSHLNFNAVGHDPVVTCVNYYILEYTVDFI